MRLLKLGRSVALAMAVGVAMAGVASATTGDLVDNQKIGDYQVQSTCNFKKRDLTGLNDPGTRATYDLNVAAAATPVPAATGATCEVLDRFGAYLKVLNAQDPGSVATNVDMFTTTPQTFVVCVTPRVAPINGNGFLYGARSCRTFG